VTRERGDLDCALDELERDGMDYVVVEGFKHSSLPKIVMADIEVTNIVRKVVLAEVDDALVEKLAEAVRQMEDYHPFEA
jgi:molybdopterin synthase catalytic subunit